MSGDFKFKKFVIHQDRCGMKVGTDSVSLGIWANGGKKILDIGSGTGILSLMMAQRFPEAHIIGVEIDQDAANQSRENIKESIFKDRIDIFNLSIQDYYSQYTTEKFDCVVSNPPYFTNSLKAKGDQRCMARHNDTLSFKDLMVYCSKMLCDEGLFSVIIPTESATDIEMEAMLVGFYIVRRCELYSKVGTQAKRLMIEFRKKRMPIEESSLTLNTEKYINMTKDFYL